jgi:hypothetical protein
VTQVLEYITQVHLGGSRSVDVNKLRWKIVADSLGNTLRRIYNSEEILKHKINEDKGEDDIDL